MDLTAEFSSFFQSYIGPWVIFLRMILSVVLGGIIGFEREYVARPAGMRTHILVGLAASTFAIVTLELLNRANTAGVESTDPIRIIEAVTAGVAFLASGTIIHGRGRVEGLTTGAGLWLAGAIGVACGIGLYFIALLATLFAFLVLSLLRLVEERLPKSDNANAAADDG